MSDSQQADESSSGRAESCDVAGRKTGTVYLVGAGPGDPSLLTLRGAELLRRADAVLYDSLVNPEVLELARPGARLECVGKHGKTRIWPQQEINSRMIELARHGEEVVRLKGGDPAVFARGAEEGEALAQAGIRFEIVPGVTAALAAGSYAGVPITHRDLASAVALVTGQERGGKHQSSLDFAALARFPGTLVFYMGVVTAERWTRELLGAGKPPETPSAIVRRCSWLDQRSIRCRLDEVAATIESEALRPPVIVIVGDVVNCRDTLSWFEHRPLFGRTVLVTRAPHQAADVTAALREQGAEVIFQPAIEILPPDDWQAVDESIARLSEYDWVIFTSQNGVGFFFERLRALGKDARAFGAAKLAAVGPSTAARLEELQLNVDLRPSSGDYRAESLADELAARTEGGRSRFLFLRGDRVRDVLPTRLAEMGQLDQVVVYRSVDVATPSPQVAARLSGGEIDWCTVTSSAVANSLVDMFGQALANTRLASISPLTSDALRTRGYEPAAEAEQASMRSLVSAIVSDAES